MYHVYISSTFWECMYLKIWYQFELIFWELIFRDQLKIFHASIYYNDNDQNALKFVILLQSVIYHNIQGIQRLPSLLWCHTKCILTNNNYVATYLQAVLLHMPQWPKHMQSPPLPVAFLLLLHQCCGIVWYETTATCTTVRMSVSSKWNDFYREYITTKTDVLF